MRVCVESVSVSVREGVREGASKDVSKGTYPFGARP